MRWIIPLVLAGACGDHTATIGAGYAKLVETMADPPSKLDILFVVDDSGSIFDDQTALVEAARTELFGQLQTMTGTLPDLQVAVVSTSVDINSGDFGPECAADAPSGRFLLGPAVQPCTGISGNFLVDSGGTTNFTGTLEDNFACIAQIHASGCGFEEPLEAMRLALSGVHPENAGFLRDDAMLLVVILTDEDDSSGTDPTMWSASDPYVANVREFEYGVACTPDDDSVGPRTGCVPRDNPTALNSIEQYVDFLSLVKSDPSTVIVAGIAPPPGPVNVIASAADPALLDLDGACTPPPGPCAEDPTMTCVRDPVLPAVRLDAFMSEFPARYVRASICDQTMLARVHQIARTVTGVMTNQTCVIGDLPADIARCHAVDVDASGGRVETPVTFTEDDAGCDYTSSHLRAEVAAVAAGHHLVVECLK